MPNAVYDPEDLKEQETRSRPLDDAGATPLSDDERQKLADIEAGYSRDGQEPGVKNRDRGPGSDDEKDFAPSIGKDTPKTKSLRGRLLNRKTAIGGGITGLLIGGGFGIFGILSGPMQIIHFSQLLQQFHFSNNDEFANGRTSRYLFHRTNRGGPGYAKMQTRLGVVGTRVADAMEIKLQREAGLRSLYDTRTGLLVGYELIDETRAINTLINADINPDLDLNISEGSTNNDVIGADGNRGANGRILLFKTDADGARTALKFRRNFHKSITKTLGLNRVANAIAFRKTATRGGLDLHPLRRADARINESTTDLARRLRSRWANETRNGVSPPGDPDIRTANTDAEGNVNPDAEDVDREAKQAKVDATTGEKVEAKSKIGGKLAAGSAIGIGTLCAARSISSNLEQVQHANVILPLMRIATRIVSLGSQSMSGQDIDMELLGVASETLHSEELGSWAAARSIQYENGQELTGPDIPATAKPSRKDQKPVVLEVIDTIFERAGAFGSAACSRIGQFALGIVSGGIIGTVVGEIAGAAASAAGVDPMEMFAGWIVDTLAGDAVNLDEAVGANLGNMANYGARLSANEQALLMGGALLTTQQSAQLDTDSRTSRLQEFKQKSFLTRTLSIKEPNSFIAKALFENPMLASLQTRPGSWPLWILRSIPRSFNSLFASKAYAQNTYDYGFDEYGFTLSEQEDERFDDPYANAEWVEPRLQELTASYGSCFSTKINPQNGSIEGTNTTNYRDINPECSDRSNEELVRYRFYIADVVLAKSMACYEAADEASCTELGFSGSVTASVPQTPSSASPDQDTSHMQCPAGTTDAGVEQDYGPGRVPTVKVRLCNLPTVQKVNASIAQSALNMINAAQAAGHRLSGGSWRSYDSQARLRIVNGCPDVDISPSRACRVPTARPGSSMHEVGLAIDFDGMCFGRGNSTCPSNPAWVWLTQNAATYGFKKNSAEAWHWSPTGH